MVREITRIALMSAMFVFVSVSVTKSEGELIKHEKNQKPAKKESSQKKPLSGQKKPLITNQSSISESFKEQVALAEKDPVQLQKIFRACRTTSCSDYVFPAWEKAQWEQSKKENTHQSYLAYLLHFPGGENVKKANLAIDLIDWKACEKGTDKIPCVEYNNTHKRGKYYKQSKSKIAKYDLDIAKSSPSIKRYEDFLKKHRNHQEATSLLRKLRYDNALLSMNLEGWIEFYDNSKVSSYKVRKWKKTDANTYNQMMSNGKTEIERLLYENIVNNPSLKQSRDYLKRFSSGKHKQQVIILMEPLFYEESRKENSIKSLNRYLKQYPLGYSSEQIKKLLDPAMWNKALKEKKSAAYKSYLKSFPSGEHALDAQTKITWMKQNPAKPKIEHPKKITGSGSRPRFSWVTKFSELSGVADFSVTGRGWIYNSKGSKFGPNGNKGGRGTIKVKAGGTTSDSHWVRGKTFCGGKVVYEWNGSDANGHKIKLVETIQLICG